MCTFITENLHRIHGICGWGRRQGSEGGISRVSCIADWGLACFSAAALLTCSGRQLDEAWSQNPEMLAELPSQVNSLLWSHICTIMICWGLACTSGYVTPTYCLPGKAFIWETILGFKKPLIVSSKEKVWEQTSVLLQWVVFTPGFRTTAPKGALSSPLFIIKGLFYIGENCGGMAMLHILPCKSQM